MSFAKLTILGLLCVGYISAFPGKLESKPKKQSFLEEIESEFKDEWKMWKNLYEKEYESFEEEITKFSIWLSNLRFVNNHNLYASLNRSSFTTALNEYSDLSIYDVRNTMNGYRMDLKHPLFTSPENVFTKPEVSVSVNKFSKFFEMFFLEIFLGKFLSKGWWNQFKMKKI